MALSKLDNLENRLQRYNFRIRGLPESFKKVYTVVSTFIKDLIPNIPRTPSGDGSGS